MLTSKILHGRDLKSKKESFHLPVKAEGTIGITLLFKMKNRTQKGQSARRVVRGHKGGFNDHKLTIRQLIIRHLHNQSLYYNMVDLSCGVEQSGSSSGS